MRVAIQGQAGSFHEQVAKEWYGDHTTIVPCTTFSDVFRVFEDGDADAIVTAVENTMYGSINQVYQLIEDCSAPIVGEVKLAIDQMLIVQPGTKLEDITEVYSHPVALAQCREYIEKHLPNAEAIEFFDTAGAVEFVRDNTHGNAAAIAGEQAAELYGLPIIARSIQDDKTNITRFLVLEPRDTDPRANRASLIVTTSHRPGALVEVLQLFASRNINLAKLQSQPIAGKPFTYKFFIVVDSAGEPLRDVIREIEASDHEVVLLGEYVAG